MTGREKFGLVVLFVFLLVLFLRYGTPLSSDGYYYFAYLPSLVLDKDLNFNNQYAEDTDPYGFRKQETPVPPNPFPIGAAVLWLPFFLLGRAVSVLVGIYGFLPGYGPAETYAVGIGSVVYGSLAIFLTYRLVKACVSARTAGISAVGVGLGSFLLYYTVGEPSFSHAPSACAVSVFLYLWWEWKESGGSWRAFGLGLILGLAGAVRPQNLLFVVIPGLWWFVHLSGGLTGPRVLANVRRAGSFVVGVVIGFLPQMAAWWCIYGKPLTIPQGEGFMRWTEPAVANVFFSTRHGLFAQAPITMFSLLGLMLLFGRRGRLALVMLVGLGVQGYLNAAVADWWGGAAFGMRRFAATTAILGVGLASFLDGFLDWAERHGRVLRRALVYLFVLFFVWVNVEWIVLYRRERIPGSGTWSPGEALAEVTGKRFRWLYRKVGNPFSFPANWLFAIRFRTSPARYDRVVGDYFLYDVPFPGNELNFGRAAYEHFLVEGFYPIEVDSTSPSISITGARRARVLIPLYEQVACDLRFRLAPCFASPETGADFSIAWNGEEIAAPLLTPGWNEYSAPLSPGQIRLGVNELVLSSLLPVSLPFSVKITQETELGETVTCRSRVEFHSVDSLQKRVFETETEGFQLFIGDSDVLPSATEAFNTSENAWDAWKMKKFMEAVPEGKIVIGVVTGDGARNFAQPAWEALRSVGCCVDLRGHPDRAYAFVGKKGAPPGTALEVFPTSGGAQLSLTPGDKVPVAIDWLRFQRKEVRSRKAD